MELRPRLKQDAVFMRSEDGVLFRNGNSIFHLKGTSIYNWIASLAPHLTGEQTLEELCATLAPSQREMVTRLVNSLLEKGVVKNHVPETSVPLAKSIQRHFKAQIDFIDHYVERPLARFNAFRQSRVLMVGAGPTWSALAVSLARNGLENLFLAPIGEAQGWLVEVEDEIERLRRDGVNVSLSRRDIDARSPASQLKGFQVVAYCSDRPSLRDVSLLNQHCLDEGIPFLPGIFFDGRALLGPLVKPGAAGCWLCAMLRLSANLAGNQRAALWKSVALGDELSSENACGTTARMLGNNLAFELFKLLAEPLAPETDGSLLIQDLDTLESVRVPLVPHPLCPGCSMAEPATELTRLTEVVSGRRDNARTVEEQLTRVYQYAEPQLGIFQGFTDEESAQVPLRQTSLMMGHGSGTAAPFRVVAHSDTSTSLARHHAVLEALKKYSMSLPDERRTRIASFNELLDAEAAPVAPEALEVWSGGPSCDRHERIEWLPAYAVYEQRVRMVPAAAVYAHSHFNRKGVFERTNDGLCAATTFEAARAEGMLSALRGERLRQLARGRGAACEIDGARVGAADTELNYLLKTVERHGRAARLLDLRGESPLSVVAALLDESAVYLGHGHCRNEALKQALLALLGDLQTAPLAAEVSDFPDQSARDFASAPDADLSSPEEGFDHERASTVESIDSYLKAQGQELLFVNTTTNDFWREGTFISGLVLLTARSS